MFSVIRQILTQTESEVKEVSTPEEGATCEEMGTRQTATVQREGSDHEAPGAGASGGAPGRKVTILCTLGEGRRGGIQGSRVAL